MGTSYIVWAYIQVLLPSLLFGKISETPLIVIVMKWIINFSLEPISNQELCEETAKKIAGEKGALCSWKPKMVKKHGPKN